MLVGEADGTGEELEPDLDRAVDPDFGLLVVMLLSVEVFRTFFGDVIASLCLVVFVPFGESVVSSEIVLELLFRVSLLVEIELFAEFMLIFVLTLRPLEWTLELELDLVVTELYRLGASE